MNATKLLFKKLRPVIINQSSSHKKRLNTHTDDGCSNSDCPLNPHMFSTHSKLKDYKIGNLSDSKDSSILNSNKPINPPDSLVDLKKMRKQIPDKSYLTNQQVKPFFNNSAYEHTLAILSSVSSQLKTADLLLGNTGVDSNLTNKFIPKKRILGESTRDHI